MSTTYQAIQTQLLSLHSTNEMLKLTNISNANFNEVSNLMHEFEAAFENAPCDDDGETQEQAKYTDSLLEQYSLSIYNLI